MSNDQKKLTKWMQFYAIRLPEQCKTLLCGKYLEVDINCGLRTCRPKTQDIMVTALNLTDVIINTRVESLIYHLSEEQIVEELIRLDGRNLGFNFCCIVIPNTEIAFGLHPIRVQVGYINYLTKSLEIRRKKK